MAKPNLRLIAPTTEIEQSPRGDKHPLSAKKPRTRVAGPGLILDQPLRRLKLWRAA